MSDNIDPLMNKNGDARQEVLVNTSGISSSSSKAFPWVDSAILTRTSILLSPESVTPFMNIIRRRFPEVIEMSRNQEKFIPTMDAKAMRAFSRNNKRKQGSQASGPVVVTDHEVSSSTVSDKLVSKKSCTEKEPIPTSVPLSPNQEVVQIGTSSQPLLVTPGIPKWWHWFQGFEGQPGTEVVSVFDRRLPTEQLIRSHFLKTDDFVRVKKVGMVNTAKMVQVFAAQTTVLGQALEIGVGLLEKELKEKTKKLKDGQAEVAKAKEAVSELARLQEEFKALSLEKEKAAADLDVLKKKRKILTPFLLKKLSC
ncbi:putative axin-1-like [Sesbania bispinosa]|nr:putative axin-1-like [Sesbania bispinosa]